ncbi:hypothetical protein B0T13DRAFT_138427 [Neurospora crassa]|nr:hypothetical protein B0T13DRAFT_138427 [Neurospora crassa]
MVENLKYERRARPDQHFETVSLLTYPGSVTTNIPDFPSRPDEIITTSVRTLLPAAYRWVEPRPNPYYSGKIRVRPLHKTRCLPNCRKPFKYWMEGYVRTRKT